MIERQLAKKEMELCHNPVLARGRCLRRAARCLWGGRGNRETGTYGRWRNTAAAGATIDSVQHKRAAGHRQTRENSNYEMGELKLS